MSRSIFISLCILCAAALSGCASDAIRVLVGGPAESGTEESVVSGNESNQRGQEAHNKISSDSLEYMLSGDQVQVALSKKWVVLLDEHGLVAGRSQDGVVMEVWVAPKSTADASGFLKEQLAEYLSQVDYFDAPVVVRLDNDDVVIPRNKETMTISGYDGFQATGRAREHRNLEPVVWSAGFVDHGDGEALIVLAYGPEKRLRLLRNEMDDVMNSAKWLAQK